MAVQVKVVPGRLPVRLRFVLWLLQSVSCNGWLVTLATVSTWTCITIESAHPSVE
jgi:hypothetical protein